MSAKNFMSYGDAESVFTCFANAIKSKANISDLGTAAAKDSTNAVTSGSTDLVESGAVKDAIDAAVAAAYHHAGTKTVAQLTHDLLIAANEGNVYNITDSGTTTSDFIEGIGKIIDEGSNVGICKVGNIYMFDLLSGFVDTTNFVQKSQTAGLLKNDGTVNDEIEEDVDELKSGLTNVQNNLITLNANSIVRQSIGNQMSAITLTFSGKGHTRIANMVLMLANQAYVYQPIPIMFTGVDGANMDITSVVVANNDIGVTASGLSITIPSNLSSWGTHLLFKLFPDDNITVTVSQ